MSRVTFYGFGAYVGSLTGLTECEFWDDDPVAIYKFAESALVPVDLAMNLSAARAGKISYKDIQVDDHRQDGGLTTVGPYFPTGAMIGACWLTDTYYEQLDFKPPRQPKSAPNDAYDYELTSYQYYGGEQNDRRFYGFHANIIDVKGPLSHVAIWNAGTGKVDKDPAGTWWLDLAAVALPPEAPSARGKGKGKGKEVRPPRGGASASVAVTAGPLFLEAATVKSLKLFEPKRPVGLGIDHFRDPL